MPALARRQQLYTYDPQSCVANPLRRQFEQKLESNCVILCTLKIVRVSYKLRIVGDSIILHKLAEA